MNPFLSIYKSDTVHVFGLNQLGFFPFGIPTNADLDPGDERYPVIKLDSTYPDCVPNDQEPEMNFEIETGVPIPTKHLSGTLSAELREVLSKLEMGQSAFLPVDDGIGINQLSTSCNTVRSKLKPKSFTYRKVWVAGAVSGLRIWRLE